MNKTNCTTKNNYQLFLLIVSMVAFLSSCESFHRNESHRNVSISAIKKGKALAKIYCQSCHLLPDPSLLDAKSWQKGVLPEMGPRLGIFHPGFEQYPKSTDKNLPPGFYPSDPVIDVNDWQHIIDYYTATSPDSMPPQNRVEKITAGLTLFDVIVPDVPFRSAATTYVKINAGDSSKAIVIGDAVRQNLYFINRAFKLTDSIIGAGPIVDINYQPGRMLACDIGKLNPNNGRFGKLEAITLSARGRYAMDSAPVIDSLQRPVQVTPVDLNNDGKTDYIICEFGNLTGALSWMENLGDNHFRRHVIRHAPGAIKVYVQDYNHDGLPDIWALFAQGDESIFLFTNKGDGNFDQQQLLRFPPSYGSSYFELDDFNKDGYPDIVYTCGDNADYSPVLKPYHGVYIFMNDKSNHFTQKYFFPINGCYKAMARDYDEDGDLDIATISFFADYANQPQESFVYLRNDGDFHFHPYSIPQAGKGRWLTMDAGDVDGDGKTDLILGTFSIGPSIMKHNVDWKASPPFIILKNTGR